MKRKHVILLFAAVALAVAVALPLYRDHENMDLIEASREPTVGADVKGRDGTIHYQLGGPEGGRTVVLVHGVSGPMTVWDKTYVALTGAGLRVLRYDLYGRGRSERPDLPYDERLYDDQLTDLLGALKIDGPVALVGSSMGCVISAGFRNRHPERVQRLALIGPAGFPIEASLLAPLLQVPGIGAYMMAVIGDGMLMKHNHRYFVHSERVPEAHAAFARQLEIRGTKRAIRRTMGDMPLQDYKDGYAAVGKSDVPVLLIWGEKDVTFPFAHHVAAQTLMPQAQFVPVKEAAHLPQYERDDVVNPALISYLMR
jgi:pimeloyl-ACP methyl ester carboxylesterase